MRSIGVVGAFTNPRQVGRQIPEAIAPGDFTGEGCFRFEVQTLVAGEEIDSLGLSQMVAGNGFHKGNGVLDFFDNLSVAIRIG